MRRAMYRTVGRCSIKSTSLSALPSVEGNASAVPVNGLNPGISTPISPIAPPNHSCLLCIPRIVFSGIDLTVPIAASRLRASHLACILLSTNRSHASHPHLRRYLYRRQHRHLRQEGFQPTTHVIAGWTRTEEH